MSGKYKIGDPENLHFITGTVVRWIDLFTRVEYKDELVKSIQYCQEHKGLEVYAWVIMTNHFHMIAGSNKDHLSGIIRDMKSYTSKTLKTVIDLHPSESRKDWIKWMMEREGKLSSNNKDWKLWQDGTHPVECYSRDFFNQRLEYIHNNPVKAGFVSEPEHWLYSSAKGYSDNSGMIKLHYC